MHHRKLLKLQNVVGVSPGPDKWNGKDKVTVFVQVKHKPETIKARVNNPDDSFTKKDIIPRYVRVGLRMVPTDVVSIGPVVAQVFGESPDRSHYAPLQPGCEIGERNVNYVGTAGMIVYYSQFQDKPLFGNAASFVNILKHFGLSVERRPGLLTNCHVTQQDVAKPKINDMCQPGVDGYYIGQTIYSIPLKPGKNNQVDASIIGLARDFDAKVILVGAIKGTSEANVGDSVLKYGRTTRLTNGKCVAKGVTLSVDYGNYSITFTGLDMFSGMSDHGDSGSIIVNNDGNAVGLLFAGSTTATFGIPIRKVLDTLKVEV